MVPLVAAGGGAAACIPTRAVGGIVHVDSEACGAPTSATKRRDAGVHVRVECPRDADAGANTNANANAKYDVVLTLETDKDGRFHAEKIPPLPKSCEIVVEGEGLVARRFLVADSCTNDHPGPIWDSHDGCRVVWLDARLHAQVQLPTTPLAVDGGGS